MRVLNIFLGITMTAITLALAHGISRRCCRPRRWRAFAAAAKDGQVSRSCTAAVPGQNGHRRARYLHSLGDLFLRIPALTIATGSLGVGDAARNRAR